MERRGVGIPMLRFGGLLSLLHESPGKLPCTSKEPCKEASKIWAMINPGGNLILKGRLESECIPGILPTVNVAHFLIYEKM